jgi:hypothetical protein
MLKEKTTYIDTSRTSRFCYNARIEPCLDDCLMVNTSATCLKKMLELKI